MITKNQEVVEELKKKQSEEFQEKSDHLEDGSYQETKEKTKSLSADKKKKVKKKAAAPAQKKAGFFAYFTEKWKGIFSSENNKENKTNGKEESLKKESDKIVEFSK